MTMLARHLSAGYNKKIIINDESLMLAENKINIFIGPNGSGKSTLFKTLCNQIKSYSGKIIIDGKLLSSYSTKDFAKKVGILFQENQIPHDITVKTLISYGRFPYNGIFGSLNDIDYQIINEAMRLTNVKKFENLYVNELSTGQRQLVWVAMLLAQQAKYLFLDEPTSYLDLKNQFELMNCLSKLNLQKHKTIITILHDINMAIQYADKLFVMKDGHILKSGSPSDIINQTLIEDVFDVKCKIKFLNKKPYCSFYM